MGMSVVCYRTKEEAQKRVDENYPQISSVDGPYPCKYIDPLTGEERDGWKVNVRSWSLD